MSAVDPEFPAVRAELVERGLVIDRHKLAQVIRVLGISDPGSVSALTIDAFQVTVIRRSTSRKVTPGKGLNGRGEVSEQVHERKERFVIVDRET